METIFLDTETTGLSPVKNSIIEIGIVDESGDVLLDALVDPLQPIPVYITQLTGISNAMVRGAPTRKEILPEILSSCRGKHIVIYNAAFDLGFLPEITEIAAEISCCMTIFARYYGQWSRKLGGFKRQKLGVAADYIGYRQSRAHRAVGDALTCRAVWNYLSGLAD